MRTNLLGATLLFSTLIVTSCDNTQENKKGTDQIEEQNRSFDQTPDLQDSVQLDSITGDSVDYNKPESPRM
ncbi:hypothetical protein M8998_15265 [Sphingobacterium sp. lm-10]|uniref:hypothetical protein n=1 Tax=Sphingobacterium sp. lm-10 TaxID=2944904 RepID=UPI002021F77B|nr:hypothetical protein [Sphingobacterium sp. lm-10]MCL7989309.1 hypothetical protein [Sphingobacterium sp. lm-10]